MKQVRDLRWLNTVDYGKSMSTLLSVYHMRVHYVTGRRKMRTLEIIVDKVNFEQKNGSMLDIIE